MPISESISRTMQTASAGDARPRPLRSSMSSRSLVAGEPGGHGEGADGGEGVDDQVEEHRPGRLAGSLELDRAAASTPTSM